MNSNGSAVVKGFRCSVVNKQTNNNTNSFVHIPPKRMPAFRCIGSGINPCREQTRQGLGAAFGISEKRLRFKVREVRGPIYRIF